MGRPRASSRDRRLRELVIGPEPVGKDVAPSYGVKSRWPLFSMLAVASFAITFAAVSLRRSAETAPPKGPPGMAWVPGGLFTMGSDSAPAGRDERPAHQARVDGFWMDETDVTNAQF